MKWITEDVQLTKDAGDYIDTALLPLVPLSLGQNMKQDVSAGEYTTIISNEIERQFRGRLLLLPPFTYFRDEEEGEKIERLNHWCTWLNENRFKYIFAFTSDGEWKRIEEQLSPHLLWMPAVPFEHMDVEYQRQIVKDQVKQVLPLIADQWT